jgi:hypothetical protein
MKRLLLMLGVLSIVGYVACKQGDGDRCQVDDDCSSGVCNVSKGTCAGSTTEATEQDASFPIDAPDAPIDAPSDAMPDGMGG